MGIFLHISLENGGMETKSMHNTTNEILVWYQCTNICYIDLLEVMAILNWNEHIWTSLRW